MYIDDDLSINNQNFTNCIPLINIHVLPKELEIKETTKTASSASFLDNYFIVCTSFHLVIVLSVHLFIWSLYCLYIFSFGHYIVCTSFHLVIVLSVHLFIWSLYCLYIFDLRPQIIPFVSLNFSNSSYNELCRHT